MPYKPGKESTVPHYNYCVSIRPCMERMINYHLVWFLESSTLIREA